MRRVVAVGIPWYRAEDYDRLRALFADGPKLPATYEKWLKKARDLERQLAESGKTTVRAYIDPETFPNWCRQSGLNVNAQARTAFANLVALREHGSRN